MKNNRYQAKQFVVSNHIKAERKFWDRLILVSAVILCLFAFGVAAHFDYENALTNKMEATR